MTTTALTGLTCSSCRSPTPGRPPPTIFGRSRSRLIFLALSRHDETALERSRLRPTWPRGIRRSAPTRRSRTSARQGEPPPRPRYGERRLANYGRSHLTSHLRGRADNAGATRGRTKRRRCARREGFGLATQRSATDTGRCHGRLTRWPGRRTQQQAGRATARSARLGRCRWRTSQCATDLE